MRSPSRAATRAWTGSSGSKMRDQDGVGDFRGFHGQVEVEIGAPKRRPLLAIAELDSAHNEMQFLSPTRTTCSESAAGETIGQTERS